MSCLIVINGCLGVFGKIKGGYRVRSKWVYKYGSGVEMKREYMGGVLEYLV